MPMTAFLRPVLRVGLAAGAVAALAACSSLGGGGEEAAMACPQVRLDRNTAELVQFTGDGQDITDTRFAVSLEGYGGECEYDDEAVTVVLVPQFVVERGPAAPDGQAQGSFEYFVAIPSYYPDPAGKEVFPVSFRFPDPVTPRMRLRDEPVTLTLPREPGESLAMEEIYLGLQLSPAQLEYNRRRAGR